MDSNVSVYTENSNWNAESDWNNQFTSKGKIQAVATYGDQPSGYNGSGGGVGGGSGSGSDGLKEVFLDVLFVQVMTLAEQAEHHNGKILFQPMDILSTRSMDKQEQPMVNGMRWHKALANYYTGLPRTLVQALICPDLELLLGCD